MQCEPPVVAPVDVMLRLQLVQFKPKMLQEGTQEGTIVRGLSTAGCLNRSQSRSPFRHSSPVPLCLLDSWAKMRALQLFQPLAKFIPEVEEPSGGKRVQFK